MKLPADIFIAREKLTDCLLVWQKRGDKSGFLARAGYALETAAQLEADLRVLAAETDAKLVKHNPHGDYYKTVGVLEGPNGLRLCVIAIWMTERLSGRTKFITLIPD
jgi:hypothetical protein